MHYPDIKDYWEGRRRFFWDLPDSFNFGRDVVDAWAQHGDRLALIWCNADGDEAYFSFADIARSSNKLASVLRGQGIKKGDRVVVMLPRIPQWQVAFIACLKLGAVVVPCIDMLTARDLAYRLGHAGAKAIITTPANVGKVPEDAALSLKVFVGAEGEAPPVGWLDYGAAVSTAPVEFDSAAVAMEDPAVIYYTSGTAGEPKGVTHAARALYVWRVQAHYWLDLREQDLVWCTADTGWSKAGTSVLFGPWSWGVPVLFYDGPFEPARRLEILSHHRVSVFCAAATELRRLVEEDVSGIDLSALRHTVSAGETLNPEVARRWSELTGVPTREGYGQTEILMAVHNYPTTVQKPGSMGLPLPGYTVAILDGDGKHLEVGEAGTLAVQLPNPNLMLGYWQEAERSRRNIVVNNEGEWWLTGDTARLDEDGYVFFEGRSDDIISSAGYRIGPSEVENALLEHPKVRECAAVASPDAERGEVVKAFVVLVDGVKATKVLAKALQTHCKEATAPYKYPRLIEFVEDLPKNAAGKILRAELRRREFEQEPE